MKEIPTTEGTPVNAPEAELIVRGKHYYEQGLYSEAQENFRSILSNYPLSPYAEFAEIKTADSIFDGGEFASAAQAYEDFLKNRPASDAAPYVLYRAARSNQLAQAGQGRDMATLEKATKFYDELATKYPDSNYAIAARELRAEAHTMLADHEREVAKFYEKRNKQQAADARNKVLQQKWEPILAHDKEELATMEKQRETDLVVAASAVNAQPLPTAVPFISKQSMAQGQPVVEKPLPQSKYHIYKIECRPGSPGQVFVYFDKDFDQGDKANVLKNRNLTANNGSLTLQFPETTTHKQQLNCFSSNDLSLTEDGMLRLNSNRSAQLFTLQNPSRALIVLQ